MIGKRLKWGNLVREDGRTVIVAMDHGSYIGPLRGIEKPIETIKKIKEGGADTILLTPGLIKRCAGVLSSGDIGVIMRIDGSGTVHAREDTKPYKLMEVEDAISLGIDGIVAMGHIGSPIEGESLALLSSISNECMKYGIPLLAEMLPTTGPEIDNPSDPKIVKLAARVGSEIGADFIKTYYTGDSDSFKEVVESTPIPIVILGGPKRESTIETLLDVANAVKAGGIGVAFGRNIWQSDSPSKMVRAIVKIIHEGASAKEAMKEID